MRIANIMLSKSPFPFGTEKASYLYTQLFLKYNHDVLFIHKNDYDQNHLKKHEKLTCLQLKQDGFLDIVRTRLALSRWKPDIIVVHNYFSRVYWMAKGIAPMIGVAHNDKFKSLKNYDHIIALRYDTQQNVIKNGISHHKVSVIPNTCSFETDIKPQKWQNPPAIGAMGNLVAHKNFATFIQALSILHQKNIPFRAVLAGTGIEEKNLKSLAHELNITDRLTFLGFINDPQQFYQDIDIFCIPSAVEPFGLVVLEAMVTEKPIVASNIASFQQILADDTGLLADTHDPQSFASHLVSILESPERAIKMAKKAKKHYESCYAQSVVYDKLNEVLKQFR